MTSIISRFLRFGIAGSTASYGVVQNKQVLIEFTQSARKHRIGRAEYVRSSPTR